MAIYIIRFLYFEIKKVKQQNFQNEGNNNNNDDDDDDDDDAGHDS